MFGRQGIGLMDVVIVILIAGVIAALLAPKGQIKREEKSEIVCQRRLKTISEAEIAYFAHGGVQKPDSVVPDSERTNVYAEEIQELRSFMPDTIDGKGINPDTIGLRCPLDNKKYIITIQDSVLFNISCPNGHGVVVNGSYSWE